MCVALGCPRLGPAGLKSFPPPHRLQKTPKAPGASHNEHPTGALIEEIPHIPCPDHHWARPAH